MKRILILALALCLLLSVTAHATKLTPSNTSGTTMLSVTVAEEYTLVIPSALPIRYGAQATTLWLEVTGYRLATGNVLSVACLSDGILAEASGAELPYRLVYNGLPATSLTFDGIGRKGLTVAIDKSDWDAAAAGTYTDTVTFTASIQ